MVRRAADGRLQPRRWRPALSIGSLLSGLLLGVGSAVLLQQYSVQVLTRGALVRSIVASLAVAIVIPSIARAIGVRRYNRVLASSGAGRRR
jgi:hypothetical protein